MVDWIEVSRTAHQLQLDHGHRAHSYAATLEAEARREGNGEVVEFWQAVAVSIAPRKFDEK